ncbi:MAG: HAD-IC family P-type ATPase [Gemmatimonadaceae bacterium]|nr:HAD-IC family P-type ATPase [Gemmatimonadaceae bacterium]MCW5827420.1 HAD-IC family P-type ATPase [Gemmatimonadaceae bacterium]
MHPDERGLTEAEVAERRARYGANTLPAPPKVTLVQVVLHQFLSPLIYILLAAAAVALVLQDFVDAGFILVVVALNAGLGAFQEWRAEQSAAALQGLLQVKARVRRDGRERQIPAEDLVPGDIVLLESGNRVPADLRLLRVSGLDVDEAFLTGESVPIRKRTDAVAADAPLGDRRNHAFAGATVLTGRATGVVIATGTATEVGKIARSVAEESASKSPLVQRMEVFARQISIVVVAACAGMAAVALSRGVAPSEVFFLAVALAVSAIPEGLPVAVTVALSIATNRMARRRVIVRKLTAVEGLGSCTMIASDKTGTLTVNRQTVRSLALPGGATLHVSGEGYNASGEVEHRDAAAVSASERAAVERLAQAVVRCNEGRLEPDGDAWMYEGDAVDVALLALGRKLAVTPEAATLGLRAVGEIPFESERAYAAAFHQDATGIEVSVKGAMERLLSRCTHMQTVDGLVPLDAAAVEAQADAMSGAGERFIAVARGRLASDAGAPFDDGTLPPLVLLGLVGLIDPPRPEARVAVAQCRAAGVSVAMVTGDHPRTAFAIAQDLGIADHEGQVVTGTMLQEAQQDQARVAALVAGGRVFARVAPLQKLHIVEAMQAAGHFVAVTGDGVNDAPALKRANIGIAMGSGSDVTKDTAALIVTDDNFASIEAGVEEGRFAYGNIRKVTYLLISMGAAEVLLFVVALLLGLPLPLLAVQLLWLNLVTNGIQDVALAFEGGEPGAMARPPRPPSEGIFNFQMIRQVVLSGVTMGAVTAAYWYALLAMGMPEASARNQLLMMFVLMQNVHVFNCRSEQVSAFRVPLSRNWVLVGGVAAALSLHVAATYLPFTQRLLRLEPLQPVQWMYPLALAFSVLAVMELYKAVKRRRELAAA